MTRRVLALLLLVSVIVLGASLTTVHAYQASAADQARMHFRAADQRTSALLALARSDGLTAGELAPLYRRQTAISARRAPSGWAFFQPGLTSFYHQQTRDLSALAVSVQASVRAATATRRIQAQASLAQLHHAIATANGLRADARTAGSIFSADEVQFHSASLPKDFASISKSASQASLNLASSYRLEQRYVSRRVAQAGGSVVVLRHEASGQAAAVVSQLPLLGLLTSRATAYRSQEASLESDAMSQSAPFGTAVALWRLHSLARTVAADYKRTVPAKMIVVSTESQSATVYQNGKVVLTTPVTTGGPELPTDHGVFHIYYKVSPFVFHSPFPLGSPYYYPPTPIQYWMPFDGQEGLHDASWRSNFGPGSNFQPTDLGTGNYILGTHGCVNLPASAAAFIWNFAPVGTTVVVV